MIKTVNYDTWKNKLSPDQIDFILSDYFATHPDYSEKTGCLHMESE